MSQNFNKPGGNHSSQGALATRHSDKWPGPHTPQNHHLLSSVLFTRQIEITENLNIYQLLCGHNRFFFSVCSSYIIEQFQRTYSKTYSIDLNNSRRDAVFNGLKDQKYLEQKYECVYQNFKIFTECQNSHNFDDFLYATCKKIQNTETQHVNS